MVGVSSPHDTHVLPVGVPALFPAHLWILSIQIPQQKVPREKTHTAANSYTDWGERAPTCWRGRGRGRSHVHSRHRPMWYVSRHGLETCVRPCQRRLRHKKSHTPNKIASVSAPTSR